MYVSFYKFASLPDYEQLRLAIKQRCDEEVSQPSWFAELGQLVNIPHGPYIEINVTACIFTPHCILNQFSLPPLLPTILLCFLLHCSL